MLLIWMTRIGQGSLSGLLGVIFGLLLFFLIFFLLLSSACSADSGFCTYFGIILGFVIIGAIWSFSISK